MRAWETLYRVELRRHAPPADPPRGKPGVAADWLCAWAGAEHLCVNVTRKVGGSGAGEVRARLLHSWRLLEDAGRGSASAPAASSAATLRVRLRPQASLLTAAPD